MPTTHVTTHATWNEDEGRLMLDSDAFFSTRMKRLEPGAGERFVVRVEREVEAIRYHRLKWYFGYIVKQCCAFTGYAAPEMDALFRSYFMPKDVPTLHLMSDDQMREFNIHCEAYAAQTIGVVVTGPDDARHYQAA